MGINILSNYLSRSQIREYLAYILDNGIDEVIESPDSVYATDPIPVRIGSSIFSVKVFHVAKRLDNESWLTQLAMHFSANDLKPELPADASHVGVFYMSKHGRDYSGAPDLIDGEEVQGDIGDVAWFDARSWDSVDLGKTSTGDNYRLFVFWNAKPMSEVIS